MSTRARDPRSAAYARVQRNFWCLTAAAVLAVGALTQALRAPSGPVTGLVVAVSGLSALITLSLAARILIVMTCRGRHARTPRR